MRAFLVSVALLGSAAGIVGVAAPAVAAGSVSPMSIAGCENPPTPSWFVTREGQAASVTGDAVPDSWGTSLNIQRIACYESTFNPDAVNGQYHGLGQLNQADVADAGISWSSYLNGTSAHPATFYQVLAMMRYVKSRYGDTTTAWQHEENYGWY